MENYLLAFPFPPMASLTPGFALFFSCRAELQRRISAFYPQFFNHSHLKKQICLRPVITCAWAEEGFSLNSFVLRGGLRTATTVWELAPATSAWSQRKDPERPEVLLLRKSVSLFLFLPSLPIQSLSLTHFCRSAIFDFFSSQAPPALSIVS